MTLSAGTRLGPYEILSPIGAGGMGEVYRAKDTRLGREVAVKILPASFSSDADRLRRFEQEARAASALNHPNIITLHDIGQHDGAPYVVSELLEGETLRARLSGGAFTPRRAIGHALQIAQGLAAAHEKGIVHRDLKPENIFVTNDGRVKILDFGLAKLTQPEATNASLTNLPTMTPGTEPGVVLGTLGYMSPEQVRGKPADARSDIFSFGAILYEMLSGRRAFHGDTAADTISAILTREPPDLSETNRRIPESLDRIVRHCIEKSPESRFHSSSDIAFDLEAISTGSGNVTSAAPAKRSHLRLILGSVLAAAFGAALFYAGRRAGQTAPASNPSAPAFTRITFARGNVLSARFTGDGKGVVYGASWDGHPSQLFMTMPGSPESTALNLPASDIFAISPSNELAVALQKQFSMSSVGTSTLGRVPLAGGAPREVLENVICADWAPDGQSLMVVRDINGRHRLEFPIGKPLYETAASIGSARVSPDGQLVLVSMQESPSFDFSSGFDSTLLIVDRKGKARILRTEPLLSAATNAIWSPSGREVWVTRSEGHRDGYVYSIDLEGKDRRVLQVPGTLNLHDVSRDNRVLAEQDIWESRMSVGVAGAARERDVSWLNQSDAAQVSNDGSLALFSETGEAGGPESAVYLRKTDGSPAKLLGSGLATDLSSDGQWALAIPRGQRNHLVLLPTGVGEPRPLPQRNFTYVSAAFLSDGKHILSAGFERGRGARAYVESIGSGEVRAVTPEELAGYPAISPDGRLVAAPVVGGKAMIFPLDGTEPKPVVGFEAGDSLIRWSPDGSLFVYRPGSFPVQVFRLDPTTGKKTLWKELKPEDSSGVVRITRVVMSPDGRSYAYTFDRVLYSALYILEGAR